MQVCMFVVVECVEVILCVELVIVNVMSVIGWSFVGSGQNVGMVFVELKDWVWCDVDVMVLCDWFNGCFGMIFDGDVEVLLLLLVCGIGYFDGFMFWFEDCGGVGFDVLKVVCEQLFG